MTLPAPAGAFASMSLLRKLEAARSRVSQGWCQREGALDHDGVPCDVASPNACAWCLAGALYFDREALRFVRAILKCRLTFWNDSRRRKQADVVAFLGEAIELAEAA